MVYRGIVKGRTIELEHSLPYKDGEPLNASVEPVVEQFAPGSPASVVQAMLLPPHLDKEDVNELEQAMALDKLEVRS